MFDTLAPQAPDKILALMAMYRDDPRSDKLDLGVGVWRDADGLTPIFRAVKAAEHRLWEVEGTKTYTGLAGDPAFVHAMADLVLAGAVPHDRVAGAAAPGGTGALRLALDTLRLANPDVVVHLPDPTWPNHIAMLDHLGLAHRPYRYYDTATGGVGFAGLADDLGRLNPGDAVLLHGCCHNPTGANLNPSEWAEVAAILGRTGAVPLVDLAYQGFGDGLDADAAPVRLLATTLPELLVAVSSSKNFGIYRERAGALLAIADGPDRRDILQGTLATLNRLTYSFPPDHGARLVTMILDDPGLRLDWQAELEAMRQTMIATREALAHALRDATGSDRFAFLGAHRGMFSRLGATPEQVARMREAHGIYMVGDSRINVAGLSPARIPMLVAAMQDAGV